MKRKRHPRSRDIVRSFIDFLAWFCVGPESDRLGRRHEDAG